MCTKGGRRCDAKWDKAHKRRYNAKRRIARNSRKAAVARRFGGPANSRRAEMYDSLVAQAIQERDYLERLIAQHEAQSTGRVTATPFPSTPTGKPGAA